MAGLADRMATFIAERELLTAGDEVLVGVSGGVDSLVLLSLLRAEHQPTVVHVHHGLRPEADDEADFVSAICARWRVPFIVRRVSIPKVGNRQNAARRARYEILEEEALRRGIGAVAVAHHRDDVAETLLLQLFRGAGPRGWAAMPASRPILRGSEVELIRPIRFAHRREIEQYAIEAGIEWIEDPSNLSEQYRRGELRRSIIPLLQKSFGDDVMDRVAAAAELAEAYIESGSAMSTQQIQDEVVIEGGGLKVDTLRMMSEPVRLGLYLDLLGETHADAPRSAATAREIDGLLESQPGKRLDLGPVSVWREREILQFVVRDRPVRFVGTITAPGRLHTPEGELAIEEIPRQEVRFTGDPNVEVVDLDRLPDRLTLRTWREGDRIRPLGLGGSKLVSDLLTDARVPPSQRQRALVLAGDDRILWLPGQRLDESLAVTEATRRAARLRWSPADSER